MLRRRQRLGVAGITAILVAALVAGSIEAKPKKDGNGKRRQNPQALAKQFEILTIAQNFDQPSAMDFLPDGTLLVIEKAGRVFTVESGDQQKLLLDISDHVATQRERGLNGIAVASDFATSRRVYLLYAYKVNTGDGPQAMRLTQITLNDDNTLANPSSPETVLLGKDAALGKGCPPVSAKRDCPPSINSTHQGGTVISAEDGTLWLGFGDSNIPSNLGAQTFRTFNPDSTAGKILHIDANGNGLPGHPFCPKTDDLTRTCTKVFAIGFRNPFRFSLTPEGDPIAGDVGWNLREEIDLVKPGGNYGWPCFEGELKTPFYREQGRCKELYRKAKKEGIVGPLYEYANPPGGGAAGAAVIVGPRYLGGAYPDNFDGGYFFGDYAKAFIKLIRISKKGKAKTTALVSGVGPVAFDLAPDGNLVFADFVTGAVRKLVFTGTGNKSPQAKISASPSSGPGPNMTVNFSSAGTIDPDGDELTYEWDFGDSAPVETGPSATHTYTANGTYTAKLKVTDSRGATDTASIEITVGNTVPSAAISAPTGSTLSRGGAPVSLQATGSDAEDGVLPPSAFRWRVTLFHKQHQHPLGNFTGDSTQFEAVTDHDADSHHEITLTVTDSGGLTTVLGPVTVNPETARLKIASRPTGIELSYGGRDLEAPKKLNAAIGFRANLSAPAAFELEGHIYNFVGWSQRGRRSQIYTVPEGASRVVARYKRGK